MREMKWNEMTLEEKIEDLRGWRTAIVLMVFVLVAAIMCLGAGIGSN